VAFLPGVASSKNDDLWPAVVNFIKFYLHMEIINAIMDHFLKIAQIHQYCQIGQASTPSFFKFSQIKREK
jgi:hypothetical protein